VQSVDDHEAAHHTRVHPSPQVAVRLDDDHRARDSDEDADDQDRDRPTPGGDEAARRHTGRHGAGLPASSVVATTEAAATVVATTEAAATVVVPAATDAEELPLRERRYLAARGGMLRGGQDPAFLDVLVEGVLDQHEAQALAGHGPDLPQRQADRADQHDLVVGGVVYSATEWEPDGEGGVRWIGDGGVQDCSVEEEVEAPSQTPSAGEEREVPRAVRLAGMFGGPMYGPPAPDGTTAHDPQQRQPRRNDQVGGGGTAGHRRGHDPTREQGQEFGR